MKVPGRLQSKTTSLYSKPNHTTPSSTWGFKVPTSGLLNLENPQLLSKVQSYCLVPMEVLVCRLSRPTWLPPFFVTNPPTFRCQLQQTLCRVSSLESPQKISVKTDQRSPSYDQFGEVQICRSIVPTSTDHPTDHLSKPFADHLAVWMPCEPCRCPF